MLPGAFFDPTLGMTVGPGGGLLFTVPGAGIRCLDPASGAAALAERVQAYRQAKADRDPARMQAIRDSLVRQRDEPAAAVLERRLGSWAKEPLFDLPVGSRPRLPAALRREIGSFLLDPPFFNFRAALALEAVLHDPPEPAP